MRRTLAGISSIIRQVSMPSEYDETTERSHTDHTGGTEEPRRLRELLRAAMIAEGFVIYAPEWWHYDYKDWRECPILDLSFSEPRPAKTREVESLNDVPRQRPSHHRSHEIVPRVHHLA